MNPKLTISHLRWAIIILFWQFIAFKMLKYEHYWGGNSSRGHGKRKSTLKLLTNILLDDRHSKSKSNDPTRGC